MHQPYLYVEFSQAVSFQDFFKFGLQQFEASAWFPLLLKIYIHFLVCPVLTHIACFLLYENC